MSDKESAYQAIRSNSSIKLFFLALFITVIVAMGFIYRYYFWPFVFAFIFYVPLKPLHARLLRYFKSKRLVSFILIIAFLVMVAVPTFFLMLSLANQTYEFYQYLTHEIDLGLLQRHLYSNPITGRVLAFFGIEEGQMLPTLVAYLQETALGMFSSLTDAVSFSLKFVINFFFMLLFLFFLFDNGPKVGESIYHLLPFPNELEKDVAERLRQVIKVLVAGNILIMILQGAMVWLGFVILDIPVALLAGCVATIFSLVPVIGTSLVWLPGSMYLLLTGNTGSAIFLLVWCLVWYLILENVLKPKVFGKKLNFHPLVFFFLLLGSLQTLGLPGVIIGPMLLTLFYALWEIYSILDLYGKKGTISPVIPGRPDSSVPASSNNDSVRE